MKDKVLVLKKRELAYLLGCRGACYIVGPNLEKVSEEQIPMIIEELCRRGWLYKGDNCFQVSEEISLATAYMMQVTKVYSLFVSDKNVGACCIYPGDKMLVVQETATRRDSLYMRFLEKEELFSFLEEEGYMAVRAFEGKVPDIDMEKQYRQVMLTDRKDLQNDMRVSLCMSQILTQGGVTEEQIAVFTEGLYDYILYTNANERKIIPYTPQSMQKLWEERAWF